MTKPVFYPIQSFPFIPPVDSKNEYYQVRRNIRVLRKFHGCEHPDVETYLPYFALEPDTVEVTRRHYVEGKCIHIGIVKPCRKLPEG